MPTPHKYWLGKSRRGWVHDAARSIIAGMDAPGRYLMYRQGFVHFEKLAGPRFKELAGFTFDTTELREIWDYVLAYMYHKERRLIPQFEKAYNRAMQPGEPYRPSDENPKLVITDADIDTENAQGRRHIH